MIHRPTYLYHGTPNKHIRILKPRAQMVRSKDEGAVVFATINEAIASKFMIPFDDSWSDSGAYNGVEYITFTDKAKLKTLDNGGSIYKLSSETFVNERKYGGRETEWTSKTPVKPLSKKDFSSALDTMIKFGVQVYFVSPTQLAQIKESHDHGYKFMQTQISENETRKQNVIKF